MKEVYLARRGDEVIHHTDRKAMLEIDNLKPEKTVSLEEFESAGGLVRIIGNEIVLGKTKTELAAETELSGLTAEQADLQAELAAKDYKVVKAAEAGLVLAQADPELHARREYCRARINEIRARIAELENAA
jgi:hypothetical protein